MKKRSAVGGVWPASHETVSYLIWKTYTRKKEALFLTTGIVVGMEMGKKIGEMVLRRAKTEGMDENVGGTKK